MIKCAFDIVGAFSVRIGLPPAVTGWAASCDGGPYCFLSKGAGAGPIATQLGPVCAQTYATPARSKFFGKQNRSRRAMTG